MGEVEEGELYYPYSVSLSESHVYVGHNSGSVKVYKKWGVREGGREEGQGTES